MKRHWGLGGLLVAIGLFLAWFFFAAPMGRQKVSYEPSSKECFTDEPGHAWKYCIYSPSQGSNGGLAYHFHGRGLDENSWNDDTYYTAMIQKYWTRYGIKPPKVVSVSFGPIWVLNSKTSNPKSGLFEVFLNDVMAQVEKQTGRPSYRVVFGESMGGLNALIVGLRTESLFKRVISLCPPIYQGSPFDSLSEVRAFLRRTGADPKVIFGMRSLSKQYANNEKEWAQISPMKLLGVADPSIAPEIYLSTALYDKYGNFEGSEAFSEAAASRGFKITWRPLYGGHCSIDVSSVAAQLLE